jgi:hypothetical protein
MVVITENIMRCPVFMRLVVVESKERIDEINVSHFTGKLQQTEYLALHETRDTRYIASYVRHKRNTLNKAGKARKGFKDPK